MGVCCVLEGIWAWGEGRGIAMKELDVPEAVSQNDEGSSWVAWMDVTVPVVRRYGRSTYYSAKWVLTGLISPRGRRGHLPAVQTSAYPPLSATPCVDNSIRPPMSNQKYLIYGCSNPCNSPPPPRPWSLLGAY